MVNLEEFFSKLLFARQLKIHEGYMEIYGVPYVFFPAESFSILIDSVINVAGKKGKIEIYKQGIRVGKSIATTLKRNLNAKGDALLDVIIHIGGMGGWGEWEFYKKDDIKKEVIVHAKNIATAQYAYKIKKRKEPSCHLLRGIIAGEMREIWEIDDIEAIETQCISQGYPYCEFVFKKKDKFDRKNKYVKTQLDL